MQDNNIEQLTTDLKGQVRQVESMLPAGMDVKRFMRTAINAISTHSQADKLLRADRQSLFNACQKAAGDGLWLDGREATLVVFKNEVAYMPMVQGLVKLARNSGDIRSVVAEVVHKKDSFVYRPGVDSQPLHKPDWFGDRGEPIGCYAVVTTKDDEKIVSVLPRERILAIGQGGRNSDQYVPGKGAHYGEWWKKTAIKNVLKYAPKSTCLESAIANDNELFDVEAIPCTEDSRLVKLRNRLHGHKATARTVSQSPPARSENGQYGDTHQNTAQNAIDSDAEAIGDPLTMALGVVQCCQSIAELDKAVEDIGLVADDTVMVEVKQAAEVKRGELDNG